jgi:peptidoglycan hydrolase-like protein with peptidoglycan-binding domain
MMKVRNLAALLTVAALPACSMFGGDKDRSSRAAAPTQTAAVTPAQPAPPPATQAPLTADTIRSVQQTLKQQNLYRGRVDGVWGPATEAAVRSYQQQHNLNASGQLDPQTLGAMNLTASNNPPPDQTNPPPAPPNNNVNPPPPSRTP